MQVSYFFLIIRVEPRLGIVLMQTRSRFFPDFLNSHFSLNQNLKVEESLQFDLPSIARSVIQKIQ